MSAEPVLLVKEGYITKRALVSGRNWKRRFFRLMSDGSLLYKNTHEDEVVKNTIALGVKSKALILKDMAAEGGFTLEGPSHDPVFLKADSIGEAKEWIKKINDVIKRLVDKEAKQRNNTLEIFAKGGGKDFRAGGGSRAGGREKRTPAPPEGGWTMRVGAGKTAKDVFVDANTWMYYADHAAFQKASKALGKADLAALV